MYTLVRILKLFYLHFTVNCERIPTTVIVYMVLGFEKCDVSTVLLTAIDYKYICLTLMYISIFIENLSVLNIILLQG